MRFTDLSECGSRNMSRQLFAFAAVASALMCLAAALFWVRRHWIGESFGWGAAGRNHQIISVVGELQVDWQTGAFPAGNHPATRYHRFPTVSGLHPTDVLNAADRFLGTRRPPHDPPKPPDPPLGPLAGPVRRDSNAVNVPLNCR